MKHDNTHSSYYMAHNHRCCMWLGTLDASQQPGLFFLQDAQVCYAHSCLVFFIFPQSCAFFRPSAAVASPTSNSCECFRSASDTTRLFQHNTIRSLQTASNQTFSIAAPQIWNSLAISIRNSPSLDTFKKALKHKLFPV